MSNERSFAAARDANLAVGTNAVELVSQVVQEIAGNDIANTINGEMVDSAFLKGAVAAKINANLAPQLGEG